MIIETYDGQTEQCDDGTDNSKPDACRSDCTLARCGDGVIDSAEICDDGNQEYGDGCNPKCKPFECGDGIVEAPEECDGGELNSNTGSCTLECRDARCGDGFIQEGVERCDDGDTGNSDTLETNCQPASCGMASWTRVKSATMATGIQQMAATTSASSRSVGMDK